MRSVINYLHTSVDRRIVIKKNIVKKIVKKKKLYNIQLLVLYILNMYKGIFFFFFFMYNIYDSIYIYTIFVSF